MKEAVVFNGLNALDFEDIRKNVIRIPEVARRVAEAQHILDCMQEKDFDLLNFIASDDLVYLSSIKLKSLAAAVVQVGLFDRYKRFHREPDYYVGSYNCDSPVKVCTGQMSLEEMIIQSQALVGSQPVVPIQAAKEPQLSGISLTEYATFERRETEERVSIEKVEMDKMDVAKVVKDLVDNQGVQKFISIGPGFSALNGVQSDLSMSEVQFLESIDLDPMLSWFWPGVKFQEARAVSQ